ncbi:TPA: excinuclease ABC subunit C [Candidatus Kaiserbacteria bacterium]|nr:excinuclease ABC subunit C [Candidatus Kaiserbacteria bacterium]
MYYVYLLHSKKDNRLYTGFTTDLRRRLAGHSMGTARSTRSRLPFQLIYYEAYMSQTDAKGREFRLKASQGARAALKRRLQYSLRGRLV